MQHEFSNTVMAFLNAANILKSNMENGIEESPSSSAPAETGENFTKWLQTPEPYVSHLPPFESLRSQLPSAFFERIPGIMQ